MFHPQVKTKPVLKWAGGKSGPLEHLFHYFPAKAKKYYEPFFGGGAVFFALKESIPSHINDANSELIHLYRVIQKNPRKLMKLLDEYSSQYSEKFYYEVRASFFEDEIEQAARTIFLNKTGYNGLYRVNSSGKFNVPFGKRSMCPKLYVKENLMSVSQRLKNARITNWDFEKVINLAKEESVIYCDPPYEPLTATASFNQYLAGGFCRKEQERLKLACERAVRRGVKVILSNSHSPFIKNLYSDWKINFIPAKRMINSKGNKRGYISETVILMEP